MTAIPRVELLRTRGFDQIDTYRLPDLPPGFRSWFWPGYRIRTIEISICRGFQFRRFL